MRKSMVVSIVASAMLLGSRSWSELPVVRAGEEPVAIKNGDANGDGDRNLSDAVALLNWLF